MKYLLDRHDNSRGRRYIPYYDIVFVLDSSDSISRADFKLSVSAAQSLVPRFDPDSSFAAVTFGASASVSFNFNSSKVSIEIDKGILLTDRLTNTGQSHLYLTDQSTINPRQSPSVIYGWQFVVRKKTQTDCRAVTTAEGFILANMSTSTTSLLQGQGNNERK